MYCIKTSFYALVFFAGVISSSFTAQAMGIKPNAGLAMQFTNNSTNSPDNEKSDLLIISSVGARVDAASGSLQLEADTSLQYINYTHDTFTNQRYFNLNATAGWEMLRDRLDWQIQDFFSQQPIDAFSPNTPNNIQDSNVFVFGPSIYFRPSDRQLLTLNPQYRDFYYEKEDIDNRQNSLDVIWTYQLAKTLDVGFHGGINAVDYLDPLITDNTFRHIHLTIATTRPDYSYRANLGTTHVERDGSENVHGLTGNMRWTYGITPDSDLRAYIASELTDSNDALLSSALNADDGGFSNEQISSDVLRNNVVRFAYLKNDAALSTNLWLEARKQVYDFALLDQNTQEAGMEFIFPLSSIVSTGVNASYARIDLTDTGRQDNQYSFGWNINYRFSRRLLATADLQYYEVDSTNSAMSYSETSILFSLVYDYDTTRSNLDRRQRTSEPAY
ncbi:MAG: outer membrane beta-barrel protein [Gammaproteobacteria bacterium]|nr:outer membrane beta-barrel protein [Gammaproteobacteria bacterium]